MVEVFRTNVKQPETASRLKDYIVSLFPGNRVNFDLHDCDNILRVEGTVVATSQIIEAMHAKGYHAELL